MNELRSENEKQILKMSTTYSQKTEALEEKYDSEKKRLITKHKEELSLLQSKIKDLERQQQRDKA